MESKPGEKIRREVLGKMGEKSEPKYALDTFIELLEQDSIPF